MSFADIEHTDGKRYFTWDKTKFPNPEEMQRKLADHGRKMVTIVDPHIKRDGGYNIHSEAEKHGYYIKEGGKDFDGWCWPGSSSYLDLQTPTCARGGQTASSTKTTREVRRRCTRGTT